jgi:hypothetical protein
MIFILYGRARAKLHATCLLIVERVLKMSGARNKVRIVEAIPHRSNLSSHPLLRKGRNLVWFAPGDSFQAEINSFFFVSAQHQFLVTTATRRHVTWNGRIGIITIKIN